MIVQIGKDFMQEAVTHRSKLYGLYGDCEDGRFAAKQAVTSEGGSWPRAPVYGDPQRSSATS
jgi:hypothetical protein